MCICMCVGYMKNKILIPLPPGLKKRMLPRSLKLLVCPTPVISLSLPEKWINNDCEQFAHLSLSFSCTTHMSLPKQYFGEFFLISLLTHISRYVISSCTLILSTLFFVTIPLTHSLKHITSIIQKTS